MFRENVEQTNDDICLKLLCGLRNTSLYVSKLFLKVECMNSLNTFTRNLNTKTIYNYSSVTTYFTPTSILGICVDSSSNLFYTAGTTLFKIDTTITSVSSSSFNTTLISSQYTATDSINNIYLVDLISTNNYNLVKITPANVKSNILTASTNIATFTFDNSDNLFVTTASVLTFYLAGSYGTGYTILTGSGGTVSYANIINGSTKASQLIPSASRYFPFANKGVLYVTAGEFVIQIKLSDIYANYSTNSNIPIYKFAGTGTKQTITSDINGSLATSVTLNNARGMTFDNFGNAYIMDQSSKMVFKVNISTNIITLFLSSTNTLGTKLFTSLLTGGFYMSTDKNNNKIYISNNSTTANILMIS